MNIKYISRIAILAAIAVLINILELPIPRPLPWAKLGLANLISLLVLLKMGFMASLQIILLRVLLTAIITANFSIGFFLALSGAVISLSIMNIMNHFNFSIYSISIGGALSHNFIQLLIVWSILIKHGGVFINLPFMIVAGIICGFLIAVLTSYLLSKKSINNLFSDV